MGDGAHPGPRSPGKVTARIIGTNQAVACIERMLLYLHRRNGVDPQRQRPRPRLPSNESANPQHLTVVYQHRPSLVNMQKKKKKKKDKRKKSEMKKKGGGGATAQRRGAGRTDVSYFT